MAEDEDILKKARFNSETLVAWGTCAVFGGLPAMANQYELEDLIEESFGAAADPFAYYMSGLDRTQALQAHDPDLLLRKARKLDDIVKVDYFLPGCPPDVSRFMDLVKELKGEEMDRRAKAVVCAECPRKPFKNNVQSMWAFPSAEAAHDICFISQGALCMGLMTRGGCDASCVKGGLPCWGCRGPTAKVIKELNEGGYCEELLSALVARRTKLQPETLRMAVRILRQKGGTSFCFEQNFIKDPSRLR
jgi:F420-non-reducing hydrogenase small subunit